MWSAQVPPELLWHESSTTAVVLVESGGTEFDSVTQDLYAGRNIGRSLLQFLRVSRATMTDDEQRIRKTALLALGPEME